MFHIAWTEAALSTYRQLEEGARNSLQKSEKDKKARSSRIEGLFKQVYKTVALLSQNPRHPGLQTHAYSSMPNPYKTSDKAFEAYVQNNTPGAYRVFWCYGPKQKEITIIAITPHP